MLKKFITNYLKKFVVKDLTKKTIADLKKINTPEDFTDDDIYHLLQMILSIKLMAGMHIDNVKQLLHTLTQEAINDLIKQAKPGEK